MNIKFSAVTGLLVASMTVEYISIDTAKIFLALNYAAEDSSYFLVLLVPTIALIGPVLFGPVAGVITDRIATKSYYIPLQTVALTVPVVILSTKYSRELQFLALTLLSMLAYLSANIRIASSKHMVPKEEFTSYHTCVVWVMQIVPLAAPLFAGLLVSLAASIFQFFLVAAAIMSAGVFVFWQAQTRGDAHSVRKDGKGYKGMGRAALGAGHFILKDHELSHSVVVAGLVNVVVFMSGYAGIVAFKANVKLQSEFASVLDGAPLIALGIGALLGALFARKVKSTFASSQALSVIMFASIGLLLLQAMTMTTIYSLLVCFCVGITGSLTSILAWDVRLQRSSPENIGTIAGVTGSAYKIPSLVLLPIVGLIASATDIRTACIFAAAILIALYLISRKTRYITSAKYSQN
ncbi:MULTISPECIES: MFS transporter [Rhizobium/Agrobacterium group]|uniref:MFS transporter n=1 Tax=Rhizobium/Agrobacterium group TaxID=227290 RepID=UPI000B3F72E2|nr:MULTISPECIES: MFS transporter [Rhizobium/Agrobacterium group]MCF1485579.1 MFS transporter [Allorhizobium ampelinum]NSZ46270.1 MFS transporter [Agrobacterium vitis]NTA25366.1 MFS transporter [Allorhizobium ampelinum]OVE97156.1 hypothetical protein B7W85_02500 [Allorhizobium ampelinum]